MTWLEMTEREVYNELVGTLEITKQITDGSVGDLKDMLRAMVADLELWEKQNKKGE